MHKTNVSKIWVNGTFDLLHPGHVAIFEYAASLGELHVGIDTDRRVKELKGNDRPIESQERRVQAIEELGLTKSVQTFDSEEELERMIENLSPDIMVIGSDYRSKRIVGERHVGKVDFFERLPYSTTQKIELLKSCSRN